MNSVRTGAVVTLFGVAFFALLAGLASYADQHMKDIDRADRIYTLISRIFVWGLLGLVTAGAIITLITDRFPLT